MSMSDFSEFILNYVDDLAPIVYLVISRDGRVSQANHYARLLLGQELEGKDWSQVVVDFHGELSLQKLAAQPDQEHLLHVNTDSDLPHSLRFRFYQKDNHFLALGRPAQDNTRNLERALQEISGELSNVNRELNKKTAELFRLNEQKNRFLGIAAHDMRSPLGHILSCSGFLLEDASERINEQEKDFLTIIHDSSNFMLRLIDDILDISAIEAGKLYLNLEPTDLTGLIEENLRLNQLLAAKRDQSLVLAGAPKRLLLELDRSKIMQVMNNLVSNAIKFSPRGGVITVSLTSNDHEAVVSVTDQGPGVSDADQKVLFQPFGKTSVKDSTGEKGTGLGLSIAQRIVTGHGGRIGLDSQPGQGSTFYFSLPLNR